MKALLIHGVLCCFVIAVFAMFVPTTVHAQIPLAVDPGPRPGPQPPGGAGQALSGLPFDQLT